MKPKRFTSAPSSGTRNTRACGLPGCACAVTVPTSTKPNPNAARRSPPCASCRSPPPVPADWEGQPGHLHTQVGMRVHLLPGRNRQIAHGSEHLNRALVCGFGLLGKQKRAGQGVGKTSVSFCLGRNVKNTYETLRRKSVQGSSTFSVRFPVDVSDVLVYTMVNDVQEMQDTTRRVRR